MRRLCVLVLVGLFVMSYAYADTQDTVVFRTRMLPDNEVPPVAAPGNSATATITIHVTRDEKGNVSGAAVVFDIDYTLSAEQTFNGLHIHNALAGQSGDVAIDSGLSSSVTVTANSGSGKLTRIVNYSSADTALKFVTGLFAAPERYYVNIHTGTNPNGFMRGQLSANRLILRPVLSPGLEVPALSADAEGAALVDIQVNRDSSGTILSGSVLIDLEYRFGSPVTITGLHINNASAGANGPIVLDAGINSTTTAVTSLTRGNLFRTIDVSSSNTAGIAALTAMMNSPEQYYLNLDTTSSPNGLLRGQFSKNVYVFFNLMIGAEETLAAHPTATANSMTYIRLDRDSTGNATFGVISFNVNYNFAETVSINGLHIHNGRMGVAGPVVLPSGVSGGADSILSATGSGSINREVSVSASQTAFDYMRGVIENPENYYINLHTTVFPSGAVRAQLAKETYHFKATMTGANEVPLVTSGDTAATGWVTAKINRDANLAITGGTVTFDVNYTGTSPITFTGLHIHFSAPAGSTASPIINTNVSGGSPVVSTTGSGNITRVVNVDASNANAIATLAGLITTPDLAYINVHSTTFPNGVARSQMGPVITTVPQMAGGGEWLSAITIRNPSTTTSVAGVVDVFTPSGALMSAALIDPNTTFLIPPSGSVTVSTHNKGNFSAGLAKIFSNGNVTVETVYNHSAFTPTSSPTTTVTSRSVSIPVLRGSTATANTGIAIIANAAGTLNLSLRDASGTAIAGGSRTIDVTAGQQVSLFVTEMLPGITASQFTGTLTITTSAGTISVLALQFDGTITPVTVTALP